MLRKCIVGVFVFLLVGSGLFLWSSEKRTPRIEKHNYPEVSVAAEGRVAVKPDQRAVLSAEISGRIEKLHVDNLSPVKKGQVLVTLYNADLAESIRQHEAMHQKALSSFTELANGFRREDVQQAEAILKRAEANLELAQLNEKRDQQLAETGVISSSRYDATLAELKRAKAEQEASREQYNKMLTGNRAEIIAAAKSEMLAEKHAVDSLKGVYDKTIIRSPLDGIVILRYKNASEFAEIGDPILEVANLSEMIVEGEVNEIDAGHVARGAFTVVTSDAFPGQTFAAQVYEVSAALKKRVSDPDDPSVIIDQKILPIKVKFLKTGPLKLGMKVDLKISM